MLIHPGVQQRIVADSPAAGGVRVEEFSIQSDAVLVTLNATAVSGTLDVSVYSLVNGGETLLFVFPQLTAVTPNVLLRRSSISPEQIRVRVTYTGACTYEIYARAVAAGSSDVRILGAAGFTAYQETVGTSPILVIAASLTDRSGIVVKNWSTTQTVYIDSVPGVSGSYAYPLAPKDALALDVQAGAEIWAVADAAGADLRLVEAGG